MNLPSATFQPTTDLFFQPISPNEKNSFKESWDSRRCTNLYPCAANIKKSTATNVVNKSFLFSHIYLSTLSFNAISYVH